MNLIAFLESPEDRGSVFNARLIHEYSLKASFKRRVFFYILAIFVQRSRTNTMQLAAGQCRFQQVARIHRTFCFAGADEGMDLIDKKNYSSLLFRYVLKQGLNSFLKFASKFGSRDQRSHVERE